MILEQGFFNKLAQLKTTKDTVQGMVRSSKRLAITPITPKTTKAKPSTYVRPKKFNGEPGGAGKAHRALNVERDKKRFNIMASLPKRNHAGPKLRKNNWADLMKYQ